MPPFSTDDCKAFLSLTTGTNGRDWKRTKKEKVDGLAYRTFAHESGTTAIIKEDDRLYLVSLMPLGKATTPVGGINVQLESNIGKHIIFARDEDYDEDDRWLHFLCSVSGSKRNGGGYYFDDQHDPELNDSLEAVLRAAGYPKGSISIGDAESLHSVLLDENQTAEEGYEQLKKVLEAAGAEETPL